MTRDEMITDNLDLVHFVINKRYKGALKRYEYDDLFQAGCIGLIKAVDGYDGTIAKLSTYAVRGIDLAIRQYKRYNDFDVHVPADVSAPGPHRHYLLHRHRPDAV